MAIGFGCSMSSRVLWAEQRLVAVVQPTNSAGGSSI
jgi:hypothetical protein